VALALSSTIPRVEGAFATTATDLAASRRANVAARRPHESRLAVAFGCLSDSVQGTHTTTAADLTVLAGRANDITILAEESRLAHAFHLLLRGGHTVTLARAHPLLVSWARLLTGAATRTLVTEALGHESLALRVADEHTPALGRTARGGGPARALEFAGGSLEALLTLADGLAIDERAFTLSCAGDSILLWTGGTTSLAEETRCTGTGGLCQLWGINK